MRAPYLDDGDVRLYHGDVLDVLREMDAESVQTCVTSPPYWGLRDYGTATWEGGSAECDHVARMNRNDGDRQAVDGFGGNRNTDGHASMGARQYRETCGKCGARRVDAQLGLEPTPGEYVARMVEVFREVRRVLRDDGTLWLNLGDSFAAGGAGSPSDKSTLKGNGHAGGGPKLRAVGTTQTRASGLKPKDLVGIPWRVAFALQEDGWYLRSDVIWAKPNPMPESVTDRPTKAHEYLFLFAKSARYFYDAESIREPNVSTSKGPWSQAYRDAQREAVDGGDSFGRRWNPDGRNARSVWTITTKPYAGAHFATFPPELPERCIKAGSAEGDLVLDPFSGSGTTAFVARQLARRAVGIDLNTEYLDLAADRLKQLSLFGGAA